MTVPSDHLGSLGSTPPAARLEASGRSRCVSPGERLAAKLKPPQSLGVFLVRNEALILLMRFLKNAFESSVPCLKCYLSDFHINPMRKVFIHLNITAMNITSSRYQRFGS